MSQHVIGIDLGTTHCVVAVGPASGGEVRLLQVPQLVSPGEIDARPLLPSFVYLPAPGELAPAHVRLPWEAADDTVVGILAQRLGAQTPDRLVASAKSWICHGGVDRCAPILPWSAPDEARHMSPFAAQVALLAHIREAWQALHPSAPIAEQDVVVTVPASFDEDARRLTVDAAAAARLGTVRLLEEPQAAFYDFAAQRADVLTRALPQARLLLVVDVGGGTTDLTLLCPIAADAADVADDGRRRIKRIAVGGHLLLGGDNMDAALAHHVQKKANLERCDPTEWAALLQSVRQAKERLLVDAAPERVVVSLQRRGARLIGGTLSVTLERDEVRALLLDGFLPLSGPADVPKPQARAGLTTLGLPYATEPAIGRHVCAFLRQHAAAAREAGARCENGLPRPDLVLLNGGVFNAPLMAQRLGEVLAGWYEQPPQLLPHTSLDASVACGAARYALARRGCGDVIEGGAARAYYLGVTGEGGEPQAVCVAPKGMVEDTTVHLPQRTFSLLLDRRVSFPLYSDHSDRADAAGTQRPIDADLLPLPPLEALIRAPNATLVARDEDGAERIPVTASAALDHAGTLAVSLQTVELPPRRFCLQFALRPVDDPAPQGAAATSSRDVRATASDSAHPKQAKAQRVLGNTLRQGDATQVKGLRAAIEDLLGPRGAWSGAVCRALWLACMEAQNARAASAEHELAWMRLLGWTLRPGWGMAGDAERVMAVWQLYDLGLRHPSKTTKAAWWVMWRRIATGLGAAQQARIFADVSPALAAAAQSSPGKGAGGSAEMFSLLASLENLPAASKQAAGEWFLACEGGRQGWWTLGRLGARQPLSGSGPVVSSAVAATWLERLLREDWAKPTGAAFAAALIARVSGDPQRDLAAALRQEVIARLRAAKGPEAWVVMVTQPISWSAGDARRVLGDALPTGLRLTSSAAS